MKRKIFPPRRVIALQTCQIFGSMKEAAEAVPGARVDSISRACTGERKFAAGLCWRYADEILTRAATEGKTVRAVCDAELVRIAMRTIYGGVKP